MIPGTWYVRVNGDYLGYVSADVLYYMAEGDGNITRCRSPPM